MKLLLLLPFFIFLQTGSCSDDSDDGGSINPNFVSFLAETNEATGGCNVQSVSGTQIFCSYTGGYSSGGLSYTIAIQHLDVCRTATFNLTDNVDQGGNALFSLIVTMDGVAIDSYFGNSGTINLSDSGVSSTMRFEGTVYNATSGSVLPVEGFMECL